jgi:hypothetical protein
MHLLIRIMIGIPNIGVSITITPQYAILATKFPLMQKVNKKHIIAYNKNIILDIYITNVK